MQFEKLQITNQRESLASQNRKSIDQMSISKGLFPITTERGHKGDQGTSRASYAIPRDNTLPSVECDERMLMDETGSLDFSKFQDTQNFEQFKDKSQEINGKYLQGYENEGKSFQNHAEPKNQDNLISKVKEMQMRLQNIKLNTESGSNLDFKTYGSNCGTKDSSNFHENTLVNTPLFKADPAVQGYRLKVEQSDEEFIRNLNQRYGTQIPQEPNEIGDQQQIGKPSYSATQFSTVAPSERANYGTSQNTKQNSGKNSIVFDLTSRQNLKAKNKLSETLFSERQSKQDSMDLTSNKISQPQSKIDSYLSVNFDLTQLTSHKTSTQALGQPKNESHMFVQDNQPQPSGNSGQVNYNTAPQRPKPIPKPNRIQLPDYQVVPVIQSIQDQSNPIGKPTILRPSSKQDQREQLPIRTLTSNLSVPSFSSQTQHQQSHRKYLESEIKHLQLHKSNQENKQELYEKYAALKSESVDKDFKIQYLEKMLKEKDQKIQNLEIQVFDSKEEIYNLKQKEQKIDMKENEEFQKLHQLKDEFKSHQKQIGNILKDHFLDYESHSNTTPIGHQIQILEQHIISLKARTGAQRETRSTSKQKSWNEEFAQLRYPKIMQDKGMQPCLRKKSNSRYTSQDSHGDDGRCLRRQNSNSKSGIPLRSRKY